MYYGPSPILGTGDIVNNTKTLFLWGVYTSREIRHKINTRKYVFCHINAMENNKEDEEEKGVPEEKSSQFCT